MDNQNKKEQNENKFYFVTKEELEKTLEEYHEDIEKDFTILSGPEKVIVSSFEEEVDKNKEKPNSSLKVRKRIHFSFEARVFTMVLLILILFSGACFLVLEAIHYGKHETVYYDEVSKVQYQVILKDNEYYDNRTLGEDMEYISSIIQNIPVHFQYQVHFSTDISYDLTYYVVASTKIYDKNDSHKILYTHEDMLVDKINLSDVRDSIFFEKDIDVDYKKYNDYVTDYKNRYLLNSSSDVEIILYLDDTHETRKISSIDIPLGVQTFGITKYTTNNLNRSVLIDENSWNDYNTVCAVVASILIVISLFLLFKTTRLVLKVSMKRNKYQVRLNQILREYDRIIVIARDGYTSDVTKTIIKVENFDELLDARDTLQKPIIYSKINDVKSEFIVEDDEKLYKYILKEADL